MLYPYLTTFLKFAAKLRQNAEWRTTAGCKVVGFRPFLDLSQGGSAIPLTV